MSRCYHCCRNELDHLKQIRLKESQGMSEDDTDKSQLDDRLTVHPRAAAIRRLRQVEFVAIVLGIAAVLLHAGFGRISAPQLTEISWLKFVAMAIVLGCRITRFALTVTRQRIGATFDASGLLIPLVWMCGPLFATQFPHIFTDAVQNAWTSLALILIVVLGTLFWCRDLAARTQNSAILLVGSFLVVIIIGTLLLKMPACRALAEDGSHQAAAPWNVALFTATSASCVTGLILEPTGSYWSPLGHSIIFALFQIGGLGILTFGAFIAILSGGRGLQFREARTLREMLDAESVQSSRRILITIFSFTILVEAVGAISMMSLWSDLPLKGQIWNATFHSVSAFCNAGFSLHDDGFLNMGTHWQVWGVLSTLIILGGLGFPVIQDSWLWLISRLRRPAAVQFLGAGTGYQRLSLHTKMVLVSTCGLLVFGSMGWFLVESLEASSGASVTKRIADAWFQSVTFRTAGFNTVDHATMQPASKLLAIFLMFIGAAPGSTGGGVKTVVFAVALMNIWTIFRGREQVELFGRCIPTRQVSRSLAMIAVGIFIVMATAGLLVIFERQPDRFLDHLFEATSAFGTVGVSAGITADLTMPSRLVICVVMFLGRVGPITLLLALAAPSDPVRYDYPQERVSLG